MTAGEVLVSSLPYLEGLLALVLGGGWLKSWLTIRAQRKAADLANDASAVALLEKDIERKIAEIEKKEEKIAQLEDKIASLQTMVESERGRRMALFTQSVQMGMTCCVHMGCMYRKPGAGHGMQWYEAHKNEVNLGADTLSIEEIAEEYKSDKRTNM